MEVIIDKYGKEISKKEFIRRQKIKKYFEKKRKAGYERYLKRIRKERIKREALEKKPKKGQEKKLKRKEKSVDPKSVDLKLISINVEKRNWPS